MEKLILKKSEIAKILIIFFMLITIHDLFFAIKAELRKERLDTFNLNKIGNKKTILELKTSSDLGWFNLSKSPREYKNGLDIVFICFQYMLVPAILENNGYNKKIICYYTSSDQLIDFCQKGKKYKLIEKDIFDYFALLERID
ncbi:MAG: hypothetical protein II567_02220 [Candidatus Riflebacteria bacterium]|nr:hypothetical protein [Candidatus Riflebacteria bacterium]